MPPRKLIIIATITTLTIIAFNSYLNNNTLQPSQSTSSTINKVIVGDLTYCIPDAYFRWKNHLRGENHEIDLSLEIESLTPWNKHAKELKLEKGDYKSHKNAKKSELGIRLKSQTPKSTKYIWEQILKNSHKSTQGEHYRFSDSENYNLELDYYLSPIKDPNFSWVLGCVSGARCRLEAQLDQSTTYVISFDEKYTTNLPELENKVQLFLKNNTCQNNHNSSE